MKDRTKRTAEYERLTGETNITATLTIEGNNDIAVSTGIGFLDHMLTALSFHAGFDLTLKCEGDLGVDDHHTAEDSALALGSVLDKALGSRQGIARFGFAYAPLDDALVRAVVDISSRPWAAVNLTFQRDTIGTLATENIRHVLASLATAARMNLHVDCIRGDNDHHLAEAAFKALALALRTAVEYRGSGETPSTKGAL